MGKERVTLRSPSEDIIWRESRSWCGVDVNGEKKVMIKKKKQKKRIDGK
jgi:hypothetical protein